MALDRAGGFLQRGDLLDAVYPHLQSRVPARQGAAQRYQLKRAAAQATISRATASLERKALVVRELNRHTGRTFVRSANQLPLPAWEETARAEEDLSAHCLRVASEWRRLAARSSRRAVEVRRERSADGTEAERQADLVDIDRLHRL